MGTEPVNPEIENFSGQIADFCREIESYLCKKNDGHLIRVVGPSFELVSGWARQAIPIKVAFAGIDRYFERYYRNGPRRRPVKIDFCAADVLDVFDEWRRATGITGAATSVDGRGSAGSQQSAGSRATLPDHLERVVTKLTSARASGTIGSEFDTIIDQAARELDAARAKAGGVRGETRAQMLVRLGELDRAMLGLARARAEPKALQQIEQDAERDLAPFRPGMTADAFAQARQAAIGELLRTRFGLPTIAFE